MPVDQPRSRVETVEIRLASVGDLPQVALLFLGYRAFYGVSSTAAACEEFLRSRLSGEESVVFVAEAKAPGTGLSGFAQALSELVVARRRTRLDPERSLRQI